MRRRTLYLLMFAVPAALVALVAALAAFGAVAGALWLFVYGDEPWPAAAQALLVGGFAVTAIACWLALVRVAHSVGRGQEASAGLNRRHVGVAVGGTALLAGLIALHQWSVGNIGAPSDGLRCMDWCRGEGFDASAMPARDSGRRTCQCLDANGRVARESPLAPADAGRR